MTVLDSKARMFGLQGLRVVDASAFLILPSRHPSPTICKSRFLRISSVLLEYLANLLTND